jgi:membrane protein
VDLRALGRSVGERLRELERLDVVRAANAMAFDAFFSIVPLVALVGWGAHELVRSKPELLAPLLRVAPGPVARIADAQLMRLSESGEAWLAPLGVAGFLWLSSDGIATAMRVFENMFGARRRPWLRRRLVAIGIVVAAVTTLVTAAGLATLGAFLGGVGGVALRWLAPVVALWLLLALFFHHATLGRSGQARRGFRGAAITLALWVVVSLGFSLYVRRIANYSAFYGSLAAVIVLLLWLWLLSLALLVGGAINARFGRRLSPPA